MQATRVLLEIMIADYYTCVSRLPLNSPEYRMLQNGVCARNAADEEVVHVLCEKAESRWTKSHSYTKEEKLAQASPERILISKLKVASCYRRTKPEIRVRLVDSGLGAFQV